MRSMKSNYAGWVPKIQGREVYVRRHVYGELGERGEMINNVDSEIYRISVKNRPPCRPVVTHHHYKCNFMFAN